MTNQFIVAALLELTQKTGGCYSSRLESEHGLGLRCLTCMYVCGLAVNHPKILPPLVSSLKAPWVVERRFIRTVCHICAVFGCPHTSVTSLPPVFLPCLLCWREYILHITPKRQIEVEKKKEIARERKGERCKSAANTAAGNGTGALFMCRCTVTSHSDTHTHCARRRQCFLLCIFGMQKKKKKNFRHRVECFLFV